MTPDEELRHLRAGPAADEVPGGIGLWRYRVRTDDPEAVLARTREVLEVVLATTGPDRSHHPGLDEWSGLLPGWFVDGCRPEESEEEEARWLVRWRALGADGRRRAEAERGWALSGWLSWFEPDERQWCWWDARPHAGYASVTVEVLGWPMPDGALRWLLLLAGATAVEED